MRKAQNTGLTTGRTTGLTAALTAAMSALLLLMSPEAAADSAVCRGKVINPVTDVCWSCLFPITVGSSVRLPAPKSAAALPDPQTNAPAACVCGKGVQMRVGLNMSYWEPVRTAEIVSEPGCSPTLGGVSFGNPTAAGAGRASVTKRGTRTHELTAFYHVHWFITPWLFLMESLLDSACLETSPFDLAYLSELDPLWNDSIASFILAPESALFANPVAQAACITDCAAATAGLPVNSLFWCSGCQGSLYPLTGWHTGQPNPASRWMLLTARFATKLAREGVLLTQTGKAGQCGPNYQPILEKDLWRMQFVYPAGLETPSANGTCCRPWGRSVTLDARMLPPAGSDGAVLLWERKDCCERANPFAGL